MTKNNNENKNMSNNNETKVVCPVCGSEFAIGEHEHKVKNATVIGADSGLGTVFLNVTKRGKALEAAGIDTSKYFSIHLPTGDVQWFHTDEKGKAVPVTDDDPILQSIIGGGTVPNRSLFRRWIMSQTFHGLMDKRGYANWLKWHGYNYTWEMLVEELRVQSRLYGKDMENYVARNRWFNRELCVTMAEDYIKQLRKDAMSRKTHNCKGVPYIKINRQDIFVSDVDKKLIRPLQMMLLDIIHAKTPEMLYKAVRTFKRNVFDFGRAYSQCAAWKDAYKGSGAFFTMQNLIRFHGCKFPTNNVFFTGHMTPLGMLDAAANAYRKEGWRLFGLMKQMLEENGVDIEAKMKQWADAKKAKNLKR